MRRAFLIYLQAAAVLLVGVLTYGLTFLVAASGPWPYRAAAGLAASAVVYWGAIRSRPRSWVPEPQAAPPAAAADARRRK